MTQSTTNTYELKSPYSGEKIADVWYASVDEVKEKIDCAENGAKVMKSLTALERAQILENVVRLFEEEREQCARILADENAKPIKMARAEISRTIETYKFAAEEAKRISGEMVPMDAALAGKDRLGFTIHEPIGIIAAITPFNFPFNLVAHKLGPAFAAGNSVVLKPANQTPLSALKTAELFQRAGLPDGALNVVTGSGSVIGDVLVKDSRVRMVTFTGSEEVGRSIRAKADLKKTTLELGSNAAVVVDSSDDLESVVQRCVEGSFSFSGQVCISIQRIYVQENLFPDFVELFKEKVATLKMGDPHDEDTDISSLIQTGENNRILDWLEEAVAAGAEIAAGGEVVNGILQPTVILHSTSDMKICSKEAFAPIVNIVPYGDLDEAIELVNDSKFGLQAGIYTKTINKAMQAMHKFEVGGVIINDIPSFRVDHMPYGGVKNSGTGREGIKYAIEEMTELKFVSIKYNR